MIRDRITIYPNDWARIHTAASAVDHARQGAGNMWLCRPRPLGYEGTCDPFGGTYFGPTYEGQGLPGVVRILHAADVIRRAATDAIHKAHLNRDRECGIDIARRAVRTALALHRLYTVLDDIGVVHYEPDQVICGVTATLQVTGLRWLAGEKIDSAENRVSRADAEAFAAGADVSIFRYPR